MDSNFYKILNVNKNATNDEIKRSYKKLVLKYHPDKNNNPDASRMFRKIQIAYETLSNKNKREKYDMIDLMNNRSALHDLFLHYHELMIEICEKYDITAEEKDEIISLFDPNDFKNELDNNNIDMANKKLADRILEYISKFMIKKISSNNSYIGPIINYLSKWIF